MVNPSSYWRTYVMKVKVCGSEEGVFSLPTAKNNAYAETMSQRELLEKASLKFD